MSDEFPTPEEIISGVKGKKTVMARVIIADERGQQIQISQDQAKAIGVILGGLAYLVIGIRPTIGDTGNPGADFFTIMDGEPDHLLGAKHALPEVIDRLYHRKGIL